MTSLETRIAKLKLTWTRIREAFTTVHADFGFVVYYRDNQNWLAVLSKEIVKEALECHNTKPPEIIGFWREYHGYYTERMFEIPITIRFLTHVIESTFPKMLTFS